MSYNPRDPRGRDAEPDDSWTPDSLTKRGLDTIIGDVEWDRDETRQSAIGIRNAPAGFRTIIRALAKKHRVSFSELIRRSLLHGAAILAANFEMKDLVRVHTEARERALDLGEQRALTRLDQVHPYDFVSSETCHTTLSVDIEVKGQLSELADVCGTHLNRVAVIAVAASILTLPNERDYRRILFEEMDGFWAMVKERIQLLKL